jgi:peptide/nickel transport system permease protein
MFLLVSSFAESLIESAIARLVVRRTLLMLPTLVGVSLLLCAIARFTPGSLSVAGRDTLLSAEQTAALSDWQSAQFGYDEPFHRHYAQWIERVFAGEGALPLGVSAMTGRSVCQELGGRLPISIVLSAFALLLALFVAVPGGVMMALRAGGKADRAIFAVLLTLWSVPIVVMATLLLGYATRGGRGVEWFPSSGAPRGAGALELMWSLTLPALCLAIVACAPIARQIRAAMVEQLGAEFVQTALAKGLSRRAVVRRHVLRAALAPLATVFAMLVPRIIAGSVLVETVFSIDGMGMLAWRSAVNRDLDVVLAVALLAAVAHMVSLMLADVLYMVLDPRVRLAADGKAVRA